MFTAIDFAAGDIIDELAQLQSLNKARIQNIYLYGSRVYGTFNPESDYDILVTASSMESHKEYRTDIFNIHVITPDIFYDRLMSHDMLALECYFAPDNAKLQIKHFYSLSIDVLKLKKKAMAQSAHSWYHARIKMNDGDIERATKSLWHSLRILMFATQIIKNGSINNFCEANPLKLQIDQSESLRWKDYKKKWSSFRSGLMHDLIDAK